MSGFHQHLTEQIVTGLNETTGRRFAGTGVVPRTNRTKMSQLFAGAKSIKVSDDRPHRDGRDGANADLTPQPFDDRIVGNILPHFIFDRTDFFVEVFNRIVMIL